MEFDTTTGIRDTLNQSPSVTLLEDTIKAAAVLWSGRNYDEAIGGFTTALSKLYEMTSDPAADIVRARLYRQLVRLTRASCVMSLCSLFSVLNGTC